ncbi:MAG TPA: protein translocase subunit SecF [Gammaproteobacteria bacterium]|nr:protein translocase subunit SecF [Gammaproteobacteria bacterium]
MEFFHDIPRINFMAARKPAMIGSIIVLIIAIGSLSIQALNLGIDFTGGVVTEVHFPNNADVTQVRDALHKGGFPDATVQQFGTPRDVRIQMRAKGQVKATETTAIGNDVMAVLHKVAPDAKLSTAPTFVGAQVGSSLARKGAIAILVTLALILIYLWFRFEWRLAVGAVAATLHDIVFVIGFFSVFQFQFDLTVLAAVLAVMGYSVNDTVVVFDRIREDFRKKRRATAFEVVNSAINETLSRTIMTSGLTLLVVIAMLAVGGPVLFGFALCLLVGIIIGTYSSIFIASATALMLGVSKQDLMVKKKEELVDDRP